MEEEEPDTKYNSSEYLLVLPITHNGFNASQEDTGRGYQNMDTSRGYNNTDTGRRYRIWREEGEDAGVWIQERRKDETIKMSQKNEDNLNKKKL